LEKVTEARSGSLFPDVWLTTRQNELLTPRMWLFQNALRSYLITFPNFCSD